MAMMDARRKEQDEDRRLSSASDPVAASERWRKAKRVAKSKPAQRGRVVERTW